MYLHHYHYGVPSGRLLTHSILPRGLNAVTAAYKSSVANKTGSLSIRSITHLKETNSVALVRERTTLTGRQPFVREVSANSCGQRGVV
jgi:hypothetical protein